MLKRDELANPDSCLNRAADDEMIFVLRSHDVTFSETVRGWVLARMRRGKNEHDDPQLVEAREAARAVEVTRGGTYASFDIPPWRCFHCAFETANPDQAEAHFGGLDSERPLCFKWNNLDVSAQALEYQRVVADLNESRKELRRQAIAVEALEYRLEAYENLCASRFKGARHLNDAFNQFDSMEGRMLAAEERAGDRFTVAQIRAFMIRLKSWMNIDEIIEKLDSISVEEES